ncbi:MAG: VCBS repeat-containing protein [Reichenbachiella sp.]
MRISIEKFHFILILTIQSSCFYESFGQTTFLDVTSNVGIQHTQILPQKNGQEDVPFGSGAAWIDCDNDGDLDLYISQRVGANKLYKNNLAEHGTVKFSEMTEISSLDIEHDGSGVSVADYDNDGDQDIYLANNDQDVLLQNNGSCVFTDVTREAFPEFASFLPGRGTTASWGDLNNDGWLDLYVANHVGLFNDQNINTQDYLFLNNGDTPNTFSNYSTSLAGDFDEDGITDIKGLSFVSALSDIDNDGDLDIFTTNDCPFGPEDNKIWRNEGNMRFTEVSDEIGPYIGGKYSPDEQELKPDCQNVMGIAVGDPNRDGIQDYFYTNWNVGTESPVLLINDGKTLLDKTIEAKLKDLRAPINNEFRISWGATFIDYDLDMLLDLALAAGVLTGVEESLFSLQPNMLYHNEGIVDNLVVYEKVEDEVSGFADFFKGRTLIRGDYDNDGDPDILLINYGGDAILYNNQNSNDNNWMIVDLVGAGLPLSNKNGIGAKVVMTTPDGIVQTEEIKSGSSIGGGEDIAAYFGLGENQEVDIKVIWPSGNVSTIENSTVNRRISVREIYTVLASSGDVNNEYFDISPNPFHDYFTISFSLSDPLIERMELYDVQGKLIRSLTGLLDFDLGSRTIDVSVKSLKPGFYYLKYQTENFTEVRKIIKK